MAGKRWTLRPLQLKSFNKYEDGKLKRCLNLWDASGLGVGSSLGIGVYLLLGQVAARTAGPAVVLSFLIAAVAALFAGLCYAELGARIPRAGGAYIYSYVAVGEVVAFLVGWMMLLEGIFGTASIAKGLSVFIDSLTNGAMSGWFSAVLPVSQGSVFSSYFDLFAFAIVFVFGALIILGAKGSVLVNNIFVIINCMVILFIIIAGATQADSNNWRLVDPNESANDTIDYGRGGFFPYGVIGTLQGAAVCFYGFVGFDTISSAGEEIRDPSRNIPFSILTSMVFIFVVYVVVSIVATLMMPYYSMGTMVAVVRAFQLMGWEWAGWVVSIGAVFGICACLFGAMFPVPRLLYAMASDRLLLHWLAKVSTRRKVPMIATIFSSCIVALLASLLELHQLLLMVCVGTLFSYTMVAICVIVLRYRPDNDDKSFSVKPWFGCGKRFASQTTARIVDITLLFFIIICVALAVVVIHVSRGWLELTLLNVAALVLLLIMALQPRAVEYERYQTPLVPVIPCLSIYINVHLMVLIDTQTWIRISVWMAIGVVIYLLSLCFYKEVNKLEDINISDPKQPNGKAPVEIVVNPPTPPGTTCIAPMSTIIEEVSETNNEIDDIEIANNIEVYKTKVVMAHDPKEDEIIVQSAVENNEEKEAKIINLLDEVLQAEEDNYENISLKENKEEYVESEGNPIPHRKSYSDLSDAGSDASLGNQGLSKYDVIALVHREDLPKVSEEEEKSDKETNEGKENENSSEENIDSKNKEDPDDNKNEDTQSYDEIEEQITAFNDNDSRTDESGYSDTLDRNVFNDSTEDTRVEEEPYIPPPPPFDESYFATPYFTKTYIMPMKPPKQEAIEAETSENTRVEEEPYIPPPPPLDERYFATPYFTKAYTMPMNPAKQNAIEAETSKRESVKSNASQENDNIVFGSDRQKTFMSKLTNIFLTKLAPEPEEPEQRRRSNSTSDMVDGNELNIAFNRERPAIFFDLKNELISTVAVQSSPNLKPINTLETEKEDKPEASNMNEEAEDLSMSRKDLRSKLEDMFATGGPKPFKPLKKSNPSTPEEAYQMDSIVESTPKMPKMEKNDTLKRQKDKFGAVLNSFRMSLNKDDPV